VKKIFLTILILLNCTWVVADETYPLYRTSIKPKEVVDFSVFKTIAVLDNGRIKPLDTYARSVLLQFSGRQSYKREPAIEWFARLMFSPQLTREDKIFLINYPAIVEALGIDPEKRRKYSFSQLEPVSTTLSALAMAAEQIDPKERDVSENELIRVYKNLKLYSLLSLSFNFLSPHNDFAIQNTQTKETLGLPTHLNQFSYLDIAMRADKLQKTTKHLESKEIDQWSQAESELIEAVSNLFEWSLVYRNLPLNIVPSYNQNNEAWHSPWDELSFALQSQDGRQEFQLLQDMMAAYWNGQQLEFDIKTKAFNSSVKKRFQGGFRSQLDKILLEVIFNNLQLLFLSKIFYLITFLIFCFALIFRNAWIEKMGIITLLSGFIPHVVAMILRITILERPPVSNLYETFVFVGFISVLTGLIIEKMQKGWIGICIASIAGFVFLSIAEKFGMEGDTLQMLIAVLNSNFWLSTHVLSITIGYSGVCVAGIVGHFYILQAIFNTKDKEALASTQKILIGTLGFGLIMTFLGTNLGGIWADQSWGRFWGWDPKENGALMIVIWIAILFHSKIAKLIGPLGLAVGSCLGLIVVMWAWFGVNLLSIGLHSYGFTAGLAIKLGIYYVLQIVFLIIVPPIAKRRLIIINNH